MSPSKTKKLHYHPFLDRPEDSGIDPEKRIDVVAYWVIREYLRVRHPLFHRYIDNSIKVEVMNDRDWPNIEELPYINIVFEDTKIVFVSTDGSIGNDGDDEIAIQNLEYAHPKLPEMTVQILRDWYQRVKDIGRFQEASGDQKRLITGRFTRDPGFATDGRPNPPNRRRRCRD